MFCPLSLYHQSGDPLTSQVFAGRSLEHFHLSSLSLRGLFVPTMPVESQMASLLNICQYLNPSN